MDTPSRYMLRSIPNSIKLESTYYYPTREGAETGARALLRGNRDIRVFVYELLGEYRTPPVFVEFVPMPGEE